MFNKIRRPFTHLLVIVFAISSFQVGYAFALDMHSTEPGCLTSPSHPIAESELDVGDHCGSEHNVHCFNFMNCTSSLNVSTMLSRNYYQDPARIVVEPGYEKTDFAFVTIYPELLKRPPIVQVIPLPG